MLLLTRYGRHSQPGHTLPSESQFYRSNHTWFVVSLSLEICIQRQGREREGTIEARGMGGIGKPKLLHTNPLEGWSKAKRKGFPSLPHASIFYWALTFPSASTQSIPRLFSLSNLSLRVLYEPLPRRNGWKTRGKRMWFYIFWGRGFEQAHQ